MSLLLHFSVVKSENGQFQLVELVNSTIITQLDESMVIQHGDGYALKFDGTTKIDIHLDKFGLDLSELRTGRLEIDFNVHEVPTDGAVAPIFYYGGGKSHAVDANNKGFMIEAGHDPIFPQNQNLFYTVYGDDRIHDFRHGPTEFPSFCFDSRQALPENVWHHYEVIASDDGTVGYLNGEEANVKYNFGKKEDIAFFSAGREHQEIKLGFGYWFDKENYLKGEIGDIKIYNS